MRLIINLQHMFHRQLGVTLRGGEALVAEKLLNGAQISAFLQHMRAKGMAQRMRVNVWGKAFGNGNFLDDAADAARGQPPTAPVDEQSRRLFAVRLENFLAQGEI